MREKENITSSSISHQYSESDLDELAKKILAPVKDKILSDIKEAIKKIGENEDD